LDIFQARNLETSTPIFSEDVSMSFLRSLRRCVWASAAASALLLSVGANAAVYGPEIGTGANDFVDVAAKIKVGYYDPDTGQLIITGKTDSKPTTEAGAFSDLFGYSDVEFWDKRDSSSGLGEKGAVQLDVGSRSAGVSVTVDVNGTGNTFTPGVNYRGNWYVDDSSDLETGNILGFAIKTGNNTAFIDLGGPSAITLSDLVVFNTVGYYFEQVAEALFNVNNGELEYAQKVGKNYLTFVETYTELSAFTDRFMSVYFNGGNDQGFSHLTVFGAGTITTVPVPAALPLAAAGLGVFALLGWRKRRHAA